MEYITLAGMIVFLVLFFFLWGYIQDRKNLKYFRYKVEHSFGQVKEHEYLVGQFEKIPMFYKQNSSENCIDDITWNDLDMDTIFKNMDYTYSSAGEEYLYAMLRMPDTDPGHVAEKEKMITYFTEHPKERVELQLLFHQMGKTGKFSIYDYLNYLDELEKKSNVPQLLWDLALIPAGVLCYFSASFGVAAILVILIRNITIYFKQKKEIEPYIVSLGYILRLLEASAKFCKKEIPVVKKQQNRLKELQKGFSKFRRNSYWIAAESRVGSSGNPLDILLDYLKMVFHFDIMKFYQMLAQVREKKNDISGVLAELGLVESCIAIGWYRQTLDRYCIPDLNGHDLQIEDACHPLISGSVPNSISVNCGVLITGSNASGKSTFLKTVAINAILAQTINTVCASRYSSESFRIYSSMALRDSVYSGDSYFMVEIKSLKRIMDEANEKGYRILCFVDEVLRGTNTIERIAASAHILRCLSQENVICFAATHDIELATLMEGIYENYHFEEKIEDGDVKFNYKICNGKANTRNAIKLLEVMGYDENLVHSAESMANTFMNKGIWTF